jgi:hypothetical protein
VSVWDRWQGRCIAAELRGVRGVAAGLGFVVGAGASYGVAQLLGRVVGG